LSHAWTLTKVRMRLAMRNRAFFVFVFFVPMLFLFLFLGLWTRDPAAVPYGLASVLALTVMGSFWGLSVQLVTFREQGILRRFRLTPVGAGAMLASSIVSNYFMTIPTIFIEFAVARWLFHMQGWGNIVGVVALVTLGMTAFPAFGLIVASVTNTMQETQLINQLLWWALLLLSGATIPLPILPAWVQHVALFLPGTYLVSGLQTAMINRSGISSISLDLIALAVSTAVAFAISQQLFRWEPESKVPRRAKLWAASALIPFLLLGIWETAHNTLRSTALMDYMSIQSHSDTAEPGK
jgi:ABC-2 type transport system permease protein